MNLKIKKLFFVFGIVLFILTIVFISYRYAVFVAKRDILKLIEKKLKTKVEAEKIEFYLFKGVYIKDLRIGKHVFLNKGSLEYSLSTLILLRNMGEAHLDSVYINFEFFKELIQAYKKEGRKKFSIKRKLSFPYFSIDKINIKKLVIVIDNKEYLLEDVFIKGRVEGEKILAEIAFKNKLFDLETALKFIRRGKNINISSKKLRFKNGTVNFLIDYNGEEIKISIKESYYKNFYVKELKVTAIYENNKIRIKNLILNSEPLFMETRGIVKKFYDLRSIYFSGEGKVTLKLEDIKAQFFFVGDINRDALFKGFLYFKDISYKRYKIDSLFYKGKIFRDSIEPEEFYVLLPSGSEVRGKKNNKHIDLKISNFNDKTLFSFFDYSNDNVNFIIESKGIFEFKDRNPEGILQGIIKGLRIYFLNFDDISFTFNRKGKKNSFFLLCPEFVIRDVIKGNFEIRGNFKNVDTFKIHIRGASSVVGNFEEKGYLGFIDKGVYFYTDKIKVSYPPLYIYVDSFPIEGGELFFVLNDIKGQLDFVNFPLRLLPFKDISGEADIEGNFEFTEDFKSIKKANMKGILENIYTPYFNFDIFKCAFYKEDRKIDLRGSFRKEKGEGNFVFSGDLKDSLYFEIYGNDFKVKDFSFILKDILEVQEGIFDFYVEGVKKQKVIYSGEAVFEKIKFLFTPIFIEGYPVHVYLNVVNDTFLYDFTGIAGEGKIRGNGIFILDREKKNHNIGGKVKLLSVRLFPLENIEAVVSGDVVFEGNKDKVEIKGDLKVEEGIITPGGMGPSSSGKGISRILLDLNFEGEKIYIISEFLNAELEGNIRIVQPDFLTTIYTGNLEIKGGNIFYLGRVFEIKEGSYIMVNSENKFDADLFITAETEVFIPDEGENISVVLKVEGKLSAPSFELLSTSPLYTSSDITKALAFGETPISGLGFIEGALSYELKKRLRLQELQITGILRGDPVFTIGTYITEDVYLRYIQGLRGKGKNHYIVKYFVFPYLSLYTEKDERGRTVSGVELEIRF